jgi:hypothetical protein
MGLILNLLFFSLNQKGRISILGKNSRWIKSTRRPWTHLFEKKLKERRSSVSVNTNTHTHTAHSQGMRADTHTHTHTHTHTTFLPLYLRGVRESWRNPTLCVLIKTHRTHTLFCEHRTKSKQTDRQGPLARAL